jgi:hypothetical protein
MAEEIAKKVTKARPKDKEDVGLSDEQLDKAAGGMTGPVPSQSKVILLSPGGGTEEYHRVAKIDQLLDQTDHR